MLFLEVKVILFAWLSTYTFLIQSPGLHQLSDLPSTDISDSISFSLWEVFPGDGCCAPRGPGGLCAGWALPSWALPSLQISLTCWLPCVPFLPHWWFISWFQGPRKGWMGGKQWETRHLWQYFYSPFLSDWYFGGFVVCRFGILYPQNLEGIHHYLQISIRIIQSSSDLCILTEVFSW